MKKTDKIFISITITIIGFLFLLGNIANAVDDPTLVLEIDPDNQTTVDLGWNVVDIMPLDYAVFRDGASIAPPTSDMTFFADANVPIGEHGYQVVVYNSGVEVARSNSASIEVLDAGGGDPPDVPDPPDGGDSAGGLDYFDTSIPGFDICTELRRLTEEKVDPTVTPPYEVGLFGVDTSTSDSGGIIGGNNSNPCKDCVADGTVWNDTDNTCYDSFADCNHFGDPAGNCISDEASCPADAGDGGDVSSVATTEGSIFQKWFIDACVMDGYLTEVAHVDLTHRFEIEGSVFAEKMSKDEANLGQLFEEAFMEVTRMPDESPRIKKEDLQLASLKDFFLVLKDSNEQFTTDLMQAISEKQRIDLESLQAYELAKIEKAREDVNKLTYEVYKELVEEPLVYDSELTGNVVRSLGLKVKEEKATSAEECPFGVMVYSDAGDECLVIKKEGRVIQNVDDFIYEESLQKARDFISCFFAPWRHFPIGEDYYFAASSEEFNAIKEKTRDGNLRDGTNPDYVWVGDPVCGKDAMDTARNGCAVCPQTDKEFAEQWKSSNLQEIRECRDCIREELDVKCNTEYICEEARKNATNDRVDLFDPKFEDYKKELCPSDQIKEDIKRDMLFELARKYKFIYNSPPENWYYDPYNAGTGGDKKKCALIMANAGYDVDGIAIKELDNPLRNNTLLEYKSYQEKIWGTDLKIAIAYRPDVTDQDIIDQNQSLTSSTGFGLQSYIQNIVDKIISDYQSTRTAEYVTGEGLRAEKYLIGFPAKDSDGNTLGYYFIDTENIISPALFLKDKIAAATQAQFDLAQLAWKKNPENGGENPKCPDPYVESGGLNKDDFDNPPGPYNKLKTKCENKELEHGWYLIETTDPGTPADEKKYECRWPQFNDITCEVFAYITTQVIYGDNGLPNELPAPWEDIGNYMQIPEEYKVWFEGDVNGQSGEQLGLVKAPPAFDITEYGSQYPDLTADTAYPNIYGDAYGKDSGISMPVSQDYYINKWYKGVTQLYEKPMSEILRTWFKEE